MGAFGRKLIHTCTIWRALPGVQNSLGEPSDEPHVVAAGVACYFSQQEQKIVAESQTLNPLTVYKLLLTDGTDVQAGDLISDLVDETGAAISSLTFEVKILRRINSARGSGHHLSARLEAMGGTTGR